jgi:branched-chain amino acid transport system substrate-binding protein
MKRIAPPERRQFLRGVSALGAGLVLPGVSYSSRPVLIGADVEAGDGSSTSDEAILVGARLAIEDINSAGGLPGGRRLELVARDNRGVPSRGVHNARAFAEMPDMPAFLCGKFSAIALEQLPVLHENKLVLLNPWSAADAIIDNGYSPNFAFRIGLRDSWAIAHMLDHLSRSGLGDIGLMMPSTAWGRSSAAAIETLVPGYSDVRIRATAWHLWGGDLDIVASYRELLRAGARSILLVANEREGAALVRGVAALPPSERLPIVSHWGITGGDFAEMCGPALNEVDLQVVQTFSFHQPRNALAKSLASRAARALGFDDPRRIPSAIGVAHAYDLVHLLALGISLAPSADRSAVRDALERLPAHEGVIRRYAPAFSPTRHEGLQASDIFLARFDSAGRLLPAS